ncbi:MAG: flagellar biosynthesis protein FlhF [Lachnospiraceae bacterium]|nr:flagellar biosynthesis protein FlhF [Lachnospiraceae bacterium]
MIIKKFTGKTQTEALKAARDEMGSDAVVANTREIRPKGLARIFKKPIYEVTITLDENPPKHEPSRKESMMAALKSNPNVIVEDDVPKSPFYPDPKALELKLNNLTTMIEQQMGHSRAAMNVEESQSPAHSTEKEKKDSQAEKEDSNVECLRLIYNQLADNEVDEQYINQVIGEVEPSLKKDSSVENILSAIYQKIVLKLGKSEVLDVKPGKADYVFFIGPTGVGKTTTIAKLASKLKLEKKLNVALLTADTYRIAAVEQLHTYANILNVPLRVVYTETELKDSLDDLKNFDIVLVDTAGRSHRDPKQTDDLRKLLEAVPEDKRQVYLVLSVATKYNDLIKITQTYSDISDYRLIFTKLDETSCLGNIFNIKMLTGVPLSYATFGQQVPNDISRLDAQTIARHLLGGED